MLFLYPMLRSRDGAQLDMTSHFLDSNPIHFTYLKFLSNLIFHTYPHFPLSWKLLSVTSVLLVKILKMLSPCFSIFVSKTQFKIASSLYMYIIIYLRCWYPLGSFFSPNRKHILADCPQEDMGVESVGAKWMWMMLKCPVYLLLYNVLV